MRIEIDHHSLFITCNSSDNSIYNCVKISTYFELFSYFPHDSKVNRFFNLFEKEANFMNASQNKRSGFTELSTDFSTSDFVDNVHNSVYNSIFSHFLHFSMWITFFRPSIFCSLFGKMFFIFVILYTSSNRTYPQHFYISPNLLQFLYKNTNFLIYEKTGNHFCPEVDFLYVAMNI